MPTTVLLSSLPSGGVHKQHLMALGLSFLEAAYFFGGEFRDECFTGPNKPQAQALKEACLYQRLRAIRQPWKSS